MFSFMFKKKWVMNKSIRNYIRSRVEKKRAFEKQKTLLETQLRDKEIELEIYERLKDILEAKYYKQQQEEWTEIQNNFQNPLN